MRHVGREMSRQIDGVRENKGNKEKERQTHTKYNSTTDNPDRRSRSELHRLAAHLVAHSRSEARKIFSLHMIKLSVAVSLSVISKKGVKPRLHVKHQQLLQLL